MWCKREGQPYNLNQQAPQVIQDMNNSKNTPSSDSSDLSIAATVLWPLLIKNAVFSLAKTISLAHKEHLGSPSMC